jgi:3-oxoacyl-[acyl-carrier-protein] synthase-1
MDAPPIRIVGLGASTSVGRNAWASAAAARAGLCGFSEHPSVADTAGEPVRVACARWLDASLGIADRCCALLLPALDEALANLARRQALTEAKVGIALALPPLRPGRPADLGERVCSAIATRYAGEVAALASFESGHASGYAALDEAMRSLAASSTHAHLIAGVDSYQSRETLGWLEACEQLHGAGAPGNTWGFVPGEGAGAVLVTTARVAEELGLESLGEVAGVGLGREPHPIKTDGVCIGDGLTAAFRAALGCLPPPEVVHNVFCDLNGEPYRADEYGFTALRTKERFRAATEFVAPADVWGDVGAAGGPLHVALAVICHRKHYGKGPVSLACGSSEGGERGAAVVRAAQPAD